ncbi:hypothetical protein [Pseudoxanthomonas sp. PXM01]|uniref:hypothetical protein n=1 Tax=Pseudoxanthomonas sp. PXM01 TaxID=2769295 RepID=UPI00178156A1|nr:hypothetical protein [Pseudoxanthomonas sp. PXM01]MBD9470215.1 hypothetical protein [Pseudoxanthomonas sp. PXM01]
MLALTSEVPFSGQEEEPRWVEIEVSSSEMPDGNAVQTNSAFRGEEGDAPLFVRVSNESPNLGLVEVLDEIARMPDIPDAPEDAISSVLRRTTRGRVAAVAVYDVGQASMAALVDKNEHPLAFFDLGWPVQFNSKSYPVNGRFSPLIPFGAYPAPVVLSHLDWDHWGYAIKSGSAKKDKTSGAWLTQPVYKPDALHRAWLMRRPQVAKHKLGPSHVHFVQTLAATSKCAGDCALLFWPEPLSAITVDSVSIIRNDPGGYKATPAFLRNNESLSLRVKGAGASVLLCGDADYPSIPARFLRRLTGVVAPHHGGKTTSGAMPEPIGHGRMIASTFKGCYPSIPSPAVLSEATSKGWRVSYTDDRGSCSRCSENHGNRLIKLREVPVCGCGGVEEGGLCVSR